VARELDEVGAIVDVAEDAHATCGLTASGLGRLEADDVRPGARERVGRSEPDDSGTDNRDFGSTFHRPR
jgi:hypothetical protein